MNVAWFRFCMANCGIAMHKLHMQVAKFLHKWRSVGQIR